MSNSPVTTSPSKSSVKLPAARSLVKVVSSAEPLVGRTVSPEGSNQPSKPTSR
mgnify:CR=1 FL=1